MSNFPESPIDGALAEVLNADGSAVTYKYDKDQAAWKIVGKSGEIDNYITTLDVQTTSEPPVFPTEFTGLKSLGDIQYLTNQKLVNWTLADAIIELQDTDIIYYSATAPEDGHTYEFWFDTDALELLIWYNEQWFPVSIPPAQLKAVSEMIEGLEVSVTQVRGDIAKNKIDIDENMLDLTERIDGVEETATNVSANAAFVNQSNTFDKTNTFEGNLESDKQLTITAPSNLNTNPTFQIKGTSKTGTINSVVLHATQSGSRMRVTYRGPIDSDDEITTKKYVEDRLGGNKPDGVKSWRYIPIENWNSGSAGTGTFTVDRTEKKVYMNCHDEDGNWWVYRARTETYDAPKPHFTMYAATGTQVWDASIDRAQFYQSIGNNRITILDYTSAASYHWDNYVKENHYFVIHFLSYLPNFRERHLQNLNPADSTFGLPNEPDGLQLDEIEVQE